MGSVPLDPQTNGRIEFQIITASDPGSTAFEGYPMEQILAFLSNPNVAYLALIVGLLMLVVAVTTPGTGFAEVIDVIALAVAVIGLIQLEANFAGVVLIIAAFVLFALDVTQTQHGALTLGGRGGLV